MSDRTPSSFHKFWSNVSSVKISDSADREVVAAIVEALKQATPKEIVK